MLASVQKRHGGSASGKPAKWLMRVHPALLIPTGVDEEVCLHQARGPAGRRRRDEGGRQQQPPLATQRSAGKVSVVTILCKPTLRRVSATRAPLLARNAEIKPLGRADALGRTRSLLSPVWQVFGDRKA